MTSNQNRQPSQGNGESASKSSNYIDLHITGLGYLSRVREVTARKSKPFLAASLRGMSGEKGVEDGIQYLPFDVKAVSDQAKEVLLRLQADANNRAKRVMVQFKVSDPYIDTFRYQHGEKAGEMGTMIKARLILIRGAWVKNVGNGNERQGWTRVYELPAREQDPDAQPATEQTPASKRATGTDDHRPAGTAAKPRASEHGEPDDIPF